MEASWVTEKAGLDEAWQAVVVAEVSKTKARLVKDAERKAAKCVESVEGEYKKKLCALKKELENVKFLQSETAASGSEAESERDRLRKELEKLKLFGQEMDEEYSSSCK